MKREPTTSTKSPRNLSNHQRKERTTFADYRGRNRIRIISTDQNTSQPQITRHPHPIQSNKD